MLSTEPTDHPAPNKGAPPALDAKDTIKHLEIIQAIISRMANHSFLLKGWSVTLAAALIALAAKETSRAYALVALGPALIFWGLDAYYLQRERLFRMLYDHVRSDLIGASSSIAPFSLSTSGYQVPSWRRTLLSPTVVWLHGGIVLAVVAAILLLWLFPGKGG
jgi:hypothetical protein